MFERRPKLSFFILGLFFGALCGGILVYYNSVITNENKISVNLIPQIVKQVIGVINKQPDSKSDTTRLNNAANQVQLTESGSLTENNENENNQVENETTISSADSIATDTLLAKQDEELITIKKEELLESKEISIMVLDGNTVPKPNKNDSLLAVVSGTRDESKKAGLQKVLVELWKSPINYKGYVASKNKLVLYGFSNIDDVRLYLLKNNLMLKYAENVYNIEYNNDFTAYEKVTDSNILSQINKLNQ